MLALNDGQNDLMTVSRGDGVVAIGATSSWAVVLTGKRSMTTSRPMPTQVSRSRPAAPAASVLLKSGSRVDAPIELMEGTNQFLIKNDASSGQLQMTDGTNSLLVE